MLYITEQPPPMFFLPTMSLCEEMKSYPRVLMTEEEGQEYWMNLIPNSASVMKLNLNNGGYGHDVTHPQFRVRSTG